MLEERLQRSFSESILQKTKRKASEPSDVVDWKTKRKDYKEKLYKWEEKKTITKLQKKLDAEKAAAAAEQVRTTLRNERGRNWTLSLALPGSIMDNAQSEELRTYLAGQVARASTIFCVDEVIVFDEHKLLTKNEDGDIVARSKQKRRDGCIQLAKILQYLECPQYLRKAFFPTQPDLKYAGLLNPLDAHHHLRAAEWNTYREGVVRDVHVKEGRGSYVDVGLQKDCQIDRLLQPGLRVTVKINESSKESKRKYKGVVVSPQEPRQITGEYWGYKTRLVTCLSDALTHSTFKEPYDSIIGVSDVGICDKDFQIPKFKHLLIVFGGVGGIEASIDTDDNIKLNSPADLFTIYLNSSHGLGSRTVRTEEAILITLAMLREKILKAQKSVV